MLWNAHKHTHGSQFLFYNKTWKQESNWILAFFKRGMCGGVRAEVKCLCKFFKARNWKSFSCSTCRSHTQSMSCLSLRPALFYKRACTTRKLLVFPTVCACVCVCLENIKFQENCRSQRRQKSCWGRFKSCNTIIAGNGSAKCCCYFLLLLHHHLHFVSTAFVASVAVILI